MGDMEGNRTGMETLERDLAALSKMPGLSAMVDNVDTIIEQLSKAREKVAAARDPHTASMTMTKLQNPIKLAFDKVNDNLKDVASRNKKLGKALDKSFPLENLPADHDAMANQPALINRAIAMHLLREGQFSVASTFIDEAQDIAAHHGLYSRVGAHDDTASPEGDVLMGEDDSSQGDMLLSITASSSDHQELSSLQSQELQAKFAEMYGVLQELKARNLRPAIDWARSNSAELEARGSNLEFELCKLQYVWLFLGPTINGLPDDEYNGRSGALLYARQRFGRFQPRHLSEIQKLASALVFAPNLAQSPCKSIFTIDSAFTDVASSFTREFCSLLGLSAESPLYIAVTAGALALPYQMKFTSRTKSRGTEWTTSTELAFETPLPKRMVYHSIFVCPVAKEQTTDTNPPMMITCGHVLAKETLQKLCKGTRFKCPYCPSEGQIKDARQIIL
ncbi:CTLH/CRA C-terminal to lish motif domain-containing protein [Podospora appendiculata]|uniref:GID complex catalytic subunit 2 n=1 Tax=Podospora appendiculata TaxID=314037 RepID=A0AAE0XHL6_9PEZI|nr:CTLH/CRA C-terminal to lish motif domain-containing protein [Podospora appendiculata]